MDNPLLPVLALAELFLSENVGEKNFSSLEYISAGTFVKYSPMTILIQRYTLVSRKRQYGGHAKVGLFNSMRRPYGVKVRCRPVYRAAVENKQSNANESCQLLREHDFEFSEV